MLNLLCAPSTSKLGANHPEIGIKGNVESGIHENLRARPAGNFLYLEEGEAGSEGCLFVGEAGWNGKFLTEIERGLVNADPGCARGWVEDSSRIAELRTVGAEEVDSAGNGSRIQFREPGSLVQLPGAIRQADWSASDSAGAAQVFYYAVRVKDGQTAYVQSSGYKGRRDWVVTVLHNNGNAEHLTFDEVRARFAPSTQCL